MRGPCSTTPDSSNANWVPGRTLAALRIGLERQDYDLVAWIENLTNEDALQQVVPSGSTHLAGSVLFASSGVNTTQRRYGLTFRYRF